MKTQPKKLLNWLKINYFDSIFVLILLCLTSYIAFKNYIPGTWLLGWDDLVPEFNLKLNIARSLSAVWQEYQGVGLLGGMGHAADLPRQLILSIFSAFVPQSFIRYLWTFLMLIIAPVGVYFLTEQVVGPVSRQPHVHPQGVTPAMGLPVASHPQKIAAFTSSVFYIFNLATVQTFYTPFETFVAFFGFLPWLIYFAISYLRSGSKRKLLVFAVISLIATGAFYVQTLFVVYAIFLTFIALENILGNKKEGIKRAIKLGVVTLLINAFWLLPVVYFTITNGQSPANSHINSLATPETQLLNQARSNFSDIATLKGYWFDYYDWNGNQFDYLYKDWIGYTGNVRVHSVSIILFFISLAGLITALLKKKSLYTLSFIILFGISWFMLSGKGIGFIPLFNEIFRNSYTKWSTAFSLVLSIGIGMLVYQLSELVKVGQGWFKVGRKVCQIVGILVGIGIIAGSIYTVMPVFKGILISNSMRVKLPDYYLQTFEYFKNIDSTKRIAAFPLTDLFGWKFNDWAMPAGRQGYRGSGFLWYGIKNPILDRAFDVWSKYNENFYDEIAPCVNALDSQCLEYVLNKYQVSYVLFDESQIQPGNPNNDFIMQRQKSLLETADFITKETTFGKINVFKVNNQTQTLKSSDASALAGKQVQDDINNYVSALQYDLSKSYFNLGEAGPVVIKEPFPSIQGYPDAKNCDLKEKGSVVRKRNPDGQFFSEAGQLYGAYDGGIACDYFYYPTLDYGLAYSLRIKGRNVSGRSIKIYLYHVKNKDVELQELLTPGEFDKSFIIYPTSVSSEVGQGYTLTVETRSFGKIKSENIINAIEFSPISFTTFKREPLQVQNNLQLNYVKKYGTWAYKIEVENSGLLQLGQGYDKGWVAVQVGQQLVGVSQDSQSQLGRSAVGESWSKLEHAKVNGWSNGFLVKNGQVSQSWTKDGSELTPTNSDKFQPTSTILIFYWPQLLEWVGLIAGVLTIILLSSKRFKI